MAARVDRLERAGGVVSLSAIIVAVQGGIRTNLLLRIAVIAQHIVQIGAGISGSRRRAQGED